MDGSPRVTDVTFPFVKRGYEPDQVDAYLEELDRIVAELRHNWRGALDRADALEAQLAQVSASAPSTSEETLARALVLAQKAADDAVAEAKAEAKRIVGEATTDVAALLAEAESARDHARAEAEAEAAHIVEEARGTVEDEVAELVAQRDVLRHDLELLSEHLAAQRAALRASLGKLQQLVDLPETFRLEDGPELESLDPPMAEPTAAPDRESVGTVRRTAPGGDATVTELPTRPTETAAEPIEADEVEPEVAEVEPEVAEAEATEPEVAEVEPAAAVEPEPEPAEEVASAPMPQRRPAASLEPPAPTDKVELPEPEPEVEAPETESAEEGFATVADLTARRATQSAALDEEDAEREEAIDESFLNELRRAVNDDSGLPGGLDADEDEAMRAFFESDLDEPRRSRFGRRG